jgi:hypothetical protein
MFFETHKSELIDSAITVGILVLIGFIANLVINIIRRNIGINPIRI